MLKNIIRALRLPFITASTLPFIFGSLIKRQDFNFSGFFFGLIACVFTHLSANLINDYYDSKSGADWQDHNFYNFFGGSKLIQEKVFSPGFYLWLAILFALFAAASVIILAVILKSLLVIGLYLGIIILSWQYSQKPLEFSYHKLGEVIIFILFGFVPVEGGYFIQTRIFPDLTGFVLSLPFGFLTTAILFANEIPDFPEDKKIGKLTWVSFLGQGRAYLLYCLLIFLAFISILLSIILKYLSHIAFFSFVFILLAFKAANILKSCPLDKIKLMVSSKLTIALQTFVSLVLITSIIL